MKKGGFLSPPFDVCVRWVCEVLSKLEIKKTDRDQTSFGQFCLKQPLCRKNGNVKYQRINDLLNQHAEVK